MVGSVEDPVVIGPPAYLVEVGWDALTHCAYSIRLAADDQVDIVPPPERTPENTEPGGSFDDEDDYLLSNTSLITRRSGPIVYFTGGGGTSIPRFDSNWLYRTKSGWLNLNSITDLEADLPVFSGFTDHADWTVGGGAPDGWNIGSGGVSDDVPMVPIDDETNPAWSGSITGVTISVRHMSHAPGGEPNWWEFENPNPLGSDHFFFGVAGKTDGPFDDHTETFDLPEAVLPRQSGPDIHFTPIATALQSFDGEDELNAKRLWVLCRRVSS